MSKIWHGRPWPYHLPCDPTIGPLIHALFSLRKLGRLFEQIQQIEGRPATYSLAALHSSNSGDLNDLNSKSNISWAEQLRRCRGGHNSESHKEQRHYVRAVGVGVYSCSSKQTRLSRRGDQEEPACTRDRTTTRCNAAEQKYTPINERVEGAMIAEGEQIHAVYHYHPPLGRKKSIVCRHACNNIRRLC